MTFFIDTSVVMYAAGGEHPLKGPCARIIALIGEGGLDATTSVEVVQEILHRYRAIGRTGIGAEQASRTLDLFAPVLPITHALMRRVPDLAARYPSLASRDLVHIATCVHEGIPDIVSADRGFDAVTEIRRITPEEFAA